MARLGLHEILKQADTVSSKSERIEFLRQHDSIPLRRIFRLAYSPNVKWLLPDEEYHYRPLPPHEQLGSEMMFWKEARTTYLFVQGEDDFNANVSPQKRKQKFIELLENLHPSDAEILFCAYKDRKLPYQNITAALIREAFPGLLG